MIGAVLRALLDEVSGVLLALVGWFGLYAALLALLLPVTALRTLALVAGAYPLAQHAIDRLADVGTGVQVGVAMVVTHVWLRAFFVGDSLAAPPAEESTPAAASSVCLLDGDAHP